MINLKLSFSFTVITILALIPPLLYAADAKIINYYSKPELVTREIESRGAMAIVSELYGNDKAWHSVLQKIASGDESWLRAAIALRNGADAGASEMLALAVGEALEHNPENALKIASQAFGLKEICGGPDVDDVRYDSYDRAMKAINLRIEKVSAAKDRSLKKICKECIHYLEASKKSISDFYGIKNK